MHANVFAVKISSQRLGKVFFIKNLFVFGNLLKREKITCLRKK